MNSFIRAEAERHFSGQLMTEAAKANAAKLAAFRATKQIKDAARKASERLERAKKNSA